MLTNDFRCFAEHPDDPKQTCILRWRHSGPCHYVHDREVGTVYYAGSERIAEIDAQQEAQQEVHRANPSAV